MPENSQNYQELKTRLATDPSLLLQLRDPLKFQEDHQVSAEAVAQLRAEFADILMPRLRDPNQKEMRILSVLYVVIVLAYFLISNFFPELLNTINIPLWDDLHIVLRWGIGLYWVLAVGLSYISISQRFGGLEKTSRTTLMIAAVVLVIIPGAIVFGILPPENQIFVAQIVLVLLFTALPASLFPLFISSKGRALWDEFFTNLIFLDPVGYQSRARIYYKKFESLYGQINAGEWGPRILTGQASFPVYLNTLITGVGWLLFFSLVDIQSIDIQSGFGPNIISGVVSPFTFGFLGAYLFSLGMLFRRYLQSDLKTSAYTHSSYRILWTWVLAFILSSLPLELLRLDPQYQNQVISLAAFGAGIFPEIAFQMIGRILKAGLGIVIRSFRQEHPLNDISGITVWVESRLLEENIENIQNLVTIDIPDLMLRTNIHPSRIIDWIDQGILLLHIPKKKSGTILRGPKKDEKTDFENAIRKHGIITATDLFYSYNSFKENNKDKPEKFFLSEENDRIAQTMVDAFSDDPNMYHIKAWREVFEQHKSDLEGSTKKLLEKLESDGQLPVIEGVGNDQGETDTV